MYKDIPFVYLKYKKNIQLIISISLFIYENVIERMEYNNKEKIMFTNINKIFN